ncbi:facilitated trehalose transporter Tret1-like [Leptopilina boulardi]|uniref:facilitated trehalose transporter Tret1-like n=1 Tax=Leptopilina boulardi TaxID=63433 RepID=UPI0021F51615|nr:facilitated trehalose transporter Tret1-like [Leptopilina boulardi]
MDITNEKIVELSISEKKSEIVQFVFGICASLSAIVCGAYQAWPSPAIAHLKSKEAQIRVTDNDAMWIVSLYYAGDLVGSLLNFSLIDRIGRKYTLLAFTIPELIGWCLIIYAKHPLFFYIARFLGGVGEGGVYSTLIIYLSEIAEKNVRGILVNIMVIANYIGVFIFTAIAAYWSYDTLNYMSIFVTILSLLIFLILPETPHYYLMKGRDIDAMSCLKKLRKSTTTDVLISDMEMMKLAIVEDQKASTAGFWKVVTNSNNRKGVCIILVLEATECLSGRYATASYAHEIFAMSPLPLKPGTQVMIRNGMLFLACVAATGIIDRFNRKSLFLTTAILDGVCLAVVAFFFLLKLYIDVDVSNFAWVPLVALTSYDVIGSFGVSPLPYIIIGELFPISIKGPMVASGMIIGPAFSFITSAVYEPVTNNYGIYTTFFLYSILIITGAIIIYLILPETRGRTLEEIQAIQNPVLRLKIETKNMMESKVDNCELKTFIDNESSSTHRH